MREKNDNGNGALCVFERCVNRAGYRRTEHWEKLLERMRGCRDTLEGLLGQGSAGEGEWQERVNLELEHASPETAAYISTLREALLDMEAELVEGHLRLVLHVARRYFEGGIGSLEDMDIMQEGCRGLLMAARKHDLKGYSGFSTYAVFVIRRCIIEEVSRQSKLVRVPRSALRRGSVAKSLLDGFVAENGRLPSLDEMSRCAELEMDWLLALSLLDMQHVSIDGQGFDGLPPAPDQPHLEVAREMEARRIAEALHGLPERSKTVLVLRLGLLDDRVETLKRVAEIVGVSVERVRQIEHDALGKLRDCLYPDSERDSGSACASDTGLLP
ncbi:MAG: sigma-70 family RNA polymerase sigma factor [Candidatus Fermentibacteraceae bacterium]